MPAISKCLLFTSACAILVCLSCTSESSDQRRREANSPAGKVGQVAYEAAKQSGKVAKVAARESGKVARFAAKEVSHAAHDAHEGWKEASQKDKAGK